MEKKGKEKIFVNIINKIYDIDNKLDKGILS
jgi:hypothetical protein